LAWQRLARFSAKAIARSAHYAQHDFAANYTNVHEVWGRRSIFPDKDGSSSGKRCAQQRLICSECAKFIVLRDPEKPFQTQTIFEGFFLQ
jgi:hypothetical protein